MTYRYTISKREAKAARAAMTAMAASLGIALLLNLGAASAQKKSLEEDYKVHRLGTEQTAPYDAFVYMNRLNATLSEGEDPSDFAGRVFGALGNLEGRILVKVPPGFTKEEYEGLKLFYGYSGEGSVGNCVACHLPPTFTDNAKHRSGYSKEERVTPTLRNLAKSGPYMSDDKVKTLEEVIKIKIEIGKKAKAGKADGIDKAYAGINLTEKDIPRLVKFLEMLNEGDKEEFRELIMDFTILDTSYVFE